MKLINKLTATSVLLLVINSCGDNASFTNQVSITDESSIEIDVLCTNKTDIGDYITLQSGDVISKDENGSVLIYHSADKVKKVCLVSGKANIVRNENEI